MIDLSLAWLRPRPLGLAALFAAFVGGCQSETDAGDATAEAPVDALTVADVGFDTPEAVVHDPADDVYLVSNIAGSPADKDDNGFISRVRPDGTVAEVRWIDGAREDVVLNAPKGMAIQGDTLFVADIDVVRKFHRRTGAPLGEHVIEGATFLNGVAVGPDGAVYVTDSGLTVGPGGFADSGTDAIYRLTAGGGATPVATGTDLGRPNGLVVDAGGITFVSFGPGGVIHLTPSGERHDLPDPPNGQLDGIVRLDDGGLLVSSWVGSAVYRYDPASGYSTAVDSVPSPAAIGYDAARGRILIPIFTGNAIEIRALDR